MRGAFSGKLGPEMKVHAQEWLDATPDTKNLPEHIPPKKKRKDALKKILKRHTGKGGLEVSPYKQAEGPIDLLKIRGEPPTAMGVPKTKDNYLGNRLTK
jgi:hypothetical protein